MKIVKYILIGTGILIALLLGARALFSVQIGEALFRSAVKANLGQSALADAPDGLSAILVGTGSPLPDPGRVGPMTVVAAGDRIFIIDAGSGSARRFGELRLPWGNVEAVFLTQNIQREFWTCTKFERRKETEREREREVEVGR